MNPLFNAFQFTNGTAVKNRLFKASMSEQLSDNHLPNAELIHLYERWANGGAGTLITGNVMVDKSALGGALDVVLEKNTPLSGFQAWAKAGTLQETKLIMQINHPGKQSPKDLSLQPVAPSAIALSGPTGAFFNMPRALNEHEILAIIERFADTAEQAQNAGFSGIQIHGAHGYLVSQFLSPHHNRREDQWGGSLDNRMRFLLEIYHAIRQRTRADFVVGVKLNSADFQKGGFSQEESMQVIAKLSDLGADFIEISGGNYESPAMLEGVKDSTRKREAYFLDYAEQARKICHVPLMVTGGFRSAEAMQSAIASSATDFIGIAKPFAVQPELPNEIQNGTYKPAPLKPIRTGVKAIDSRLGSILEMGWYMYQMERLGKSLETKPNYSAWKLLFRILWQNGKQGLRKERA